MEFRRGELFHWVNGYLLVLNPGEQYSICVELSFYPVEEMVDLMSPFGFVSKEFIGTLNITNLNDEEEELTFLPIMKPIENTYLDERYGMISRDEMRSFMLKLRGVLGGFNYRKKGSNEG